MNSKPINSINESVEYTMSSYPLPAHCCDNARYLDGWKVGKLMLQMCCNCKNYIFYPRPMCPHCWSDRLIWEQASGHGKVISYSLVYRPNHPSFNEEVPIALAEIKLAEGVTILARILEVIPRSGMRVTMATDQSATQRYPLPVFYSTESCDN